MRLLVFFLLVSIHTNAQSDFYTLESRTLSDSVLPHNKFLGKKVLILIADALEPNRELIRHVDSLGQINNQIVVLIATVYDLGRQFTKGDVDKIEIECKGDVVRLLPCFATKKSGTKQNEVFKWLTTVQGNGHFGYDVAKTGQMFIVDENGRLIAVLSEGAPITVVADVLKQ